MSQLKNILLSPYTFFFGENGIFGSSSHRRPKQSNQAFYFGLPAIVFAILGLLFLVVGELSAGKTLIKKYEDNVEEIVKEKSRLSAELSQEIKLAKSKLNAGEASELDLLTQREGLAEKLDSEQIYLRKLYALAPEEPKHLYDLALTYLTKSNLTKLTPVKTEQDKRKRQQISDDQKEQGLAIMRRIAPLNKPGLLEAHLLLANYALNQNIKSRNEAIESFRLANAHLDNALIRDQANTTALGLKVNISRKMGKYKETKQYLSTLFATDPFVYRQLCQVNTQLGEADENPGVLNSAQQRLSAEISRMTGSSDRRTKYVTYLVDSLHNLDKLDEADRRVRAEMTEFSDDEGIQSWGKTLLSVGQQLRYEREKPVTPQNINEVVGYLAEGHRLDPNNVNILNYIVELRTLKIPGADKISQQIYNPGPKSPPSVKNILGKIALEKGDYVEAAKQFSRANARSPNNAQYLNNLSFVYLSRPDPDPGEALKLVDKAIRNVRAGTITGRYLSHFYDTKGRALLELGKIAEQNGDQELANSRYSAAAAKFLAALVDRPDNLSIVQGIVESYEAAGQTQQVSVWRDRVKQLQASQNQTN